VKISTGLSFAFFVAACGSGAKQAPPVVATEGSSDGAGVLARADLLAGDWSTAGENAAVTWLRPGKPGAAIYGVAAVAVPAVWVVDDVDGKVRVWRYQGELPPRVCDETEGDGLVVSCEEGAGGIKFWKNGEVLDVEEWTGSTGPDIVHLTAAELAPAPALEEAERAFDADSAARGAAAWVTAFADDGVIWRDTTLHRGSDAIEAVITKTLEAIDLRWQPTVSRILVPETLGVTAGTWVGTARADGAKATGTYLTLWRKDPTGWKIILDLGRDD
jgi:hypothetical protein